MPSLIFILNFFYFIKIFISIFLAYLLALIVPRVFIVIFPYMHIMYFDQIDLHYYSQLFSDGFPVLKVGSPDRHAGSNPGYEVLMCKAAIHVYIHIFNFTWLWTDVETASLASQSKQRGLQSKLPSVLTGVLEPSLILPIHSGPKENGPFLSSFRAECDSCVPHA
jgi:hypothetical protein